MDFLLRSSGKAERIRRVILNNGEKKEILMKGWVKGWRHIARYLDCSISTTKRYHYQYSMPVLRGPRNSPICLAAMLDIWLIEFDKLKRKYKAEQDSKAGGTTS